MVVGSALLLLHCGDLQSCCTIERGAASDDVDDQPLLSSLKYDVSGQRSDGAAWEASSPVPESSLTPLFDVDEVSLLLLLLLLSVISTTCVLEEPDTRDALRWKTVARMGLGGCEEELEGVEEAVTAGVAV